jgi:hypothetical protein
VVVGGKTKSKNASKAKKTPKQRKPWDRPEPIEPGDATPEPLYTAVGKALSNWEKIENQLANLFASFVGAQIKWRPAPAVRAYGTIVSFKSRAAMLDAAAKAYFHSRPKLGVDDRWRDLLRELEGFSDRRNDIAHGIVEALYRQENESKIEYFLMPGLYVSKKYPTDEPPAYWFTSAQVLQLAEQFSDLAASVRFLRFALVTKRRTSPRIPPPPDIRQ